MTKICTKVSSVQRAHILGTDSIILSQKRSPPSQSMEKIRTSMQN